MAKPKKQVTPKSTETEILHDIFNVTVEELASTFQPVPNTPEQAMDELTELSQELGLYDVEGNPLVKDESTVPVEASVEAVEGVQEEINTDVAQTEETPSSIGLEPLNATAEDVALLDTLLDEVTDENKHPELIPTVEVGSVLVEGVDYQQSGLDGAVVEAIDGVVKITTAEGEVREFTEPNTQVDDKLTLKDGWGQPIPTKLVVVKSMNYTDLVAQMLFAGYLGSELDRSFRILSTVPFRLRVLMPEDQYENFLSKESQPVFDENLTYNRVLVKSWDLYGFWKAIINIGKNGGIVQPRQVAQKRPMYMVPIITRAPVKDTPESRLSRVKVAYSKDELETFSLEDLRIVASWYEGIPSMNAKKGYVKAILEKQGN